MQMIKRLLISGLLLFCTALVLPGQDDSLKLEREKMPVRRNAFFIDLGGNGALWSINYDRTLFGIHNVYLTARIGYTHIIKFEENTSGQAEVMYSRNFYPIELNLIYDRSRHFYGIGLGTLLTRHKGIVRNRRACGAPLVFPKVKYRYQSPEGLFANVEAGAWPFNPEEGDCTKRLIIAPGAGLGYCF
jgi:hypothetical protein